MTSPGELASVVRHALCRANFQLVDEDDDRTPGLRVGAVGGGVLVGWTASDGFDALAGQSGGPDHRGAREAGGNLRVMVLAAVSGLLAELGHAVVDQPGGNGLVVLIGGPATWTSAARTPGAAHRF